MVAPSALVSTGVLLLILKESVKVIKFLTASVSILGDRMGRLKIKKKK